ncbi:MAG: sigma-70 family RNA polymerase sigma factor [Oscillospiraceae bacterium]|nr:sigma-70 family RNA polymerase sigma factor [Oscillospiraceae bacterium]
MAENTIVIEEHLGLVHLCANRFRSRGMEYEELYSAGCLGLIKAARAFDSERGVCFSTYAVPVIMGEIRRLFRDGGAVKIGRRLKEQSMRVAQVSEDIRQETGREPTIHMIAKRLGITEADAAEAICAAQPTVSLTACTEDGELQMDLPVPSPENMLQDKLALRQVLGLLEERDRMLIELRYRKRMIQSAAAAELGMTQVQVSRREKKILLFLREQLLR